MITPARDIGPSADAQERPQASRYIRPVSPEIVVGLTKLVDFAVVLLAAWVAYRVYIAGILALADPFTSYGLAALIAAAAFVTGLNRAGAYDFGRLADLRWQVARGFLVWIATASLLLALAYISKITNEFSRGWAIGWSLGVYGLFLVARGGLRLAVRQWANAGRLVRNIVIVGAGEPALRLIRKLRLLPATEMAILGVFDDRPGPSSIEGVPVRGNIDALLAFSREVLIDEVILALPLTAEERIQELIDRLRETPADLRLSMELLSDALPIRGVSFHGGVPVIEVVDRPLRHWNALSKWFEDKALGALLLILFMPFMAVIAALIKLDSRGPVFFVQERYGFNNKTIQVVKFRTMRADLCDPSGAARTVRNDPRLTRVGGFLRRFSLDELPQLANVVAGHMSLVGPRPHAITMRAGTGLYQDSVAEYLRRHRVKPGMTGWSQIHGLRGEIDTIEKAEARVRYDLHYIDNWSIWLDFKILLMTFRVIFARENAY
ncbi:MAG TPA: undecaprenyl-phosphate glucose phosphotransferase [Alphaproteobacteria bacterium]|nr:undecaprenyl-phosphate glucose phosphotransferase [Alphaproteobacteria bacterium]